MLTFTILRWFQRLKPGGKSEEYEDVLHTTLITPADIKTKIGEGPWIIEPNVLGEIPVVHIKNKASSRTNFGIDDCTDLVPLNREVNEKSTDVSDTINYNAAPITVLTGARAKSLERSPRAIWSIPAGATATMLRLEGDLTASVEYIKRTKEAMNEIANIPITALASGGERAVTGTTGETWYAQLTPLTDERNKKKATYEPGFERVNYFVLRYAEMFQNLRLPMGLCEKCGGKIAITYVDDPQNEGQRIEIRKCYVADMDTYDFLNPDEMKIPAIRIHSGGVEFAKQPLQQVEREHGHVQSSYWDMAKELPGESGQEAEAVGIKLPQGFKYPPEPEKFDLEEVAVVYQGVPDPENPKKPLKVIVQKERKGVFAVPILSCDLHTFLNPYTNYVTFNDTLPKDKKAQADLMEQYQRMQVVSRAYIMEQIGVENPEDMQEQIAADQAAMMPPQLGEGPPPEAGPPPDESQPPQDQAAAKEGQPPKEQPGAVGAK